MNAIKGLIHKLFAPNYSKEVAIKYHDEFMKYQIVENFNRLFLIMVFIEFSEIIFSILPFVQQEIKNITITFTITNGLILLEFLRLKSKSYKVNFNHMYGMQHLAIINLLLLTSILNIITINNYDFIHVYIVGITFMAFIIYLPTTTLSSLAYSTMVFNIIVFLIYQKDFNHLFHAIANIVIFVFTAWYLGIKSNQNKFELFYKSKQQDEFNTILQDLNERDSMTRFYNHESIVLHMNQEIKKARLNETALSVLMLDIDNFKNINDKFGHLEGDKAILEVSKVIYRCVRDTDYVGRYGGEEFLILFPETSFENAKMVSDRICKAVSNIEFDQLKMSISGGLVALEDQSEIDLLTQADERLYIAKRQGKNRIICAEEA